MAEEVPNNCSQCPSPKTVHLTQIVGGTIKKLDVCAGCELAKTAGKVGSVDLVWSTKSLGAPTKAVSVKVTKSGIACPSCGFSEETFKEFGRLGCPRCYEVFAGLLQPVFRKVHPGKEHKGKRPSGQPPPVDPKEIEAMKQSLRECVEREDFEKAAELRDRIWELEGMM